MRRVFGLVAPFLQSSDTLSQVVLLPIHSLPVLIEFKEILFICPMTAARPRQPALSLPKGIFDRDVKPADLAEFSTLVIMGHSELCQFNAFGEHATLALPKDACRHLVG